MNTNTLKFKDFIGKPAPAGYVAGLGRGATGFVTRPDIGPAKDAPLLTNEDLNHDEEEFDENEAGLLGGSGRRLGNMINDPEDDEADRIYAEIDSKMADRRRSRREKQEELEETRQEALRPKTQLLFADLKRDLSRVSEAEWASLPEVGDFRAKRLKKSGAIENPRERFLPVPDSVHSSLLSGGQTSHEIQDSETSEADFVKIGEARGKLLGMHLDQLSSGKNKSSLATSNEDISMEGQTEKADNSNLNISLIDSNTDIGDLKRARQLFASIIRANKKNPSGWISAARLELQSGNQKQARALILKGCEECAKSEEIWFEAVKIHENVNTQLTGTKSSREILASALKNMPESVNLWMLAVEKESDPSLRRKILRSALERNSRSAKLWMALVELEDSEEDARLLLSRAVECVPEAVNLWLALARLQESTQSARQVLNRARVSCPTSFSVWINAARLEEANDATRAEISKIIGRGASELALKGVKISFDEWMREGEDCEDGGDILCAEELVNHAISLEWASRATDSDKTEIFERIMKYSRESKRFVCAKTALIALLRFENSETAWILLFEIMRACKSENEKERKDLYEKALELNPQNPKFWIHYARDCSIVSFASSILSRAISVLSSETDKVLIWREFIDLEMKLFIGKQRSVEDMKAFCEKIGEGVELKKEIVKINESIGLSASALTVSLEQIKTHPKEIFFYLSACRNTVGDTINSQLNILKRGSEANPESVELALKIAQCQYDFGDVKGAKLTLEKCKLMIQAMPPKLRPSDFDQLWVALCLLEFPTGHAPSILPSGLWPYQFAAYSPAPSDASDGGKSLSSVKLLLNSALKECPKSEVLWHMAVSIEPRQLRRSKVMEGLRFLNSSAPLLLWTLSVILKSVGNETDALKELEKALVLSPANMDLMAYARSVDVHVKIPTSDQYCGINWKKFIENYKIYYFSSFDQIFEQFFTASLT